MKKIKDPLEAFLGHLNSIYVEPIENIIEIDGIINSEIDLQDKQKDYVLSGSINEDLKISGRSVALKNITIENSVTNIEATGSVILNDANIVGEFPKEKGNAITSINNQDDITIKDCTITPSLAYNGIEIGLAKDAAPKSVLIQNVNFEGKFDNNVINIFGTADNGVVNINNCHFADCSNMIRISNKNNTKLMINIRNCKIDKWNLADAYAGMILCQDYTSGSAEAAAKNNLFAPEKVTINIENVIGPNGKIEKAELSTICGTKDSNQLIYIFDRDVVAYDETRYPKINIK